MARVVRAYADPEGEDAETVDTAQRFEKELFGAYYAACAKAGSRFLREWSAFDRNLRNVSAAVTARAAGRAVEEVVVGGAMSPSSCSAVLRPISGFVANFPTSTR